MTTIQTPTVSVPAIKVANDLGNVNWMTDAVLIANDNLAFADPSALTSSGKYYVISREIAKMSVLLKDLLEDKAAGEIVEIPIPNIDGKTLSVVIMYMNYHYNKKSDKIPKPLTKPIREILSDWDKKYLDNYLLVNGNETEHQVLINVVSAATFLNIEDLMNLTCASIADMIKGKTPEKIRELLNVENDFTPEEEEQIRKETKWCEDTE